MCKSRLAQWKRWNPASAIGQRLLASCAESCANRLTPHLHGWTSWVGQDRKDRIGHDAHLALHTVKIDGTIRHGWPLFLRFERVQLHCGAETLPRHERGQPLHPIYEITAQIGVGEIVEVCRATDTKLKRQIAIKILPLSLAANADRLARVQREQDGGNEVLDSFDLLPSTLPRSRDAITASVPREAFTSRRRIDGVVEAILVTATTSVPTT